MDNYELNKQLDRVKTALFMGSNAAFFGSLLCNLNFYWSTQIDTASTDGLNINWNPDWFLSLQPDARKTVLMHELWHIARLHPIRCGNRDPRIWNYACDIRINNDLRKEYYDFRGIENCCMDLSIDKNGIMAEEDIYDLLMKDATKVPNTGSFGISSQNDLLSNSPNAHSVINNIVQAVQQAKISNQAGKLPGCIQSTLDQFLKPIIPWRKLLYKFFTDILEDEYSWKRPNKRYHDIYLPSILPSNDGRLEHLIYFLDVSGSISENDLLRFNSEVKFIHESLRPQKLTLVQFDTKITDVKELQLGDSFSKIEIKGRGGTSLVPVRKFIIEKKPTAAIIFTDLYVEPMKPLPKAIPIIWIAVQNEKATVPFGKLIHIGRE